jgi:phosphonopyruvate decarboxylase
MADAHFLVELLRRKGVTFFTGVPDSLLAGFSAALPEVGSGHLIAANEGNAVGLAAGYYLAAGRPTVVYMQNSGLGNAVNPLASLADPEVYAIPMLLIIGWRGEPGVKDEPQHVKQGRITPALLEALEIPFRLIGPASDLAAEVEHIWGEMMARSGPAALLVRAGAFGSAKTANGADTGAGFRREAALAVILNHLTPKDMVVSTTGKTSRELFELRQRRGEEQADFLTVGSMGHASSIALGAALARPERRLVVLDGDGALLMHLGALALSGALKPPNLVHVLLNNHCHESVGGQPTCSPGLDFACIAEACGYRSVGRAESEADIRAHWPEMTGAAGPHLLEIVLRPGSRPDLGRPTCSPLENKERFIAHINRGNEEIR